MIIYGKNYYLFDFAKMNYTFMTRQMYLLMFCRPFCTFNIFCNAGSNYFPLFCNVVPETEIKAETLT